MGMTKQGGLGCRARNIVNGSKFATRRTRTVFSSNRRNFRPATMSIFADALRVYSSSAAASNRARATNRGRNGQSQLLPRLLARRSAPAEKHKTFRTTDEGHKAFENYFALIRCDLCGLGARRLFGARSCRGTRIDYRRMRRAFPA